MQTSNPGFGIQAHLYLIKITHTSLISRAKHCRHLSGYCRTSMAMSAGRYGRGEQRYQLLP
jgi:hypothetical protein